ncbi:MAG TPA: thioredoxin domain-containing protein [Polyangiaceae bacterium]|nr:thioredoxin domain-containing protein [Polyangiaceae bacterium]
MNKGTAIVGFFMCFLAGMFLMWGIDRSRGVEITADQAVAAAGSVDHSAAAIPINSDDPIYGNPAAPVTIVEISDFECPFCSRVEPTINQIKETYKDKVRIVWKNNPLPFHKNARGAHEASVAVHDLGGNDAFWKFHALAFANQKALTEENFEKWAGESGVDVAKFKAAVKSGKYAKKVDEDLAFSKKVGASGTPAFRINGVTISGAQPFDKFKEVIDKELAEANKLIAAGTKPEEVYPARAKANFSAAPEQPERAEPKEDTEVWAVPVTDKDPQKGPKDALVTIVEWSEYQCPFCKRVNPTIEKVLETYKDDVRVVWKDNPLPFHPRAVPAATLARYAFETKGNAAFWDVHAALFEIQPKLEDEDLKGVADKFGLPWGNVKAAIDSNKYKTVFADSQDLATELQARGTPHFFVNGRRLSGAQPFEKFKELIDDRLKVAQAMVSKGTPKAKVYEEIVKSGKAPPPPEKKEVGAAPPDSPFAGGKNAKVVIHEFSDFECPFCSRVEPTMAQIKQEYGNKVKIVWRNLPLPFHKKADLAAEASYEVYKQKGDAAFWQYHEKLFANQKSEDGLLRPGLEKYAQELGVDMAKFKAALDNRTHKDRIQADKDAAQKAGISGTPAFVINGYYLSGAQPFPSFKKLIDRALKEAGG